MRSQLVSLVQIGYEDFQRVWSNTSNTSDQLRTAADRFGKLGHQLIQSHHPNSKYAWLFSGMLFGKRALQTKESRDIQFAIKRLENTLLKNKFYEPSVSIKLCVAQAEALLEKLKKLMIVKCYQHRPYEATSEPAGLSVSGPRFFQMPRAQFQKAQTLTVDSQRSMQARNYS